MKITRTRLWMRADIMMMVLKNMPPLNPFVFFYNPSLFFITERSKVVSFLTTKKYFEFYELKTIFTVPKYRDKGIASKLIKHLVSIMGCDLVIQCDERLEKFYNKFGFKKTKKAEVFFRFRKNFFNVFIAPLLGYKIITMRRVYKKKK